MKMINTAPHALPVPGELLDDSAYPLPVGKPLVKPSRVELPPGAVVEVDPAFALRRRGERGGDLPSVAYDLSGGMLRPHGPEAIRESRLFVDQHPVVQLRQVEMRERSMREHPELYPGFDARTSQQSQVERVATMLGLRQMATMRDLSEPESAAPVFEVEPSAPVAELPAGSSPWDAEPTSEVPLTTFED